MSPGIDYVRAHIDRTQTRSMVISSRGIVASEHPLASQAGAMALANGGHAVDAAIAANAVMGVVAPVSNGVGGDLFAIVHDATNDTLQGVNASGWAPAGLSIAALKHAGLTSMPQVGIQAVTIPGAVAGWSLMREQFGRQSFADILGSAIRIAEEGFPVTELVAGEWSSSEALLGADAASASTYLPSGRAPRVGELFRNRDLARTYRQIAEQGRDAFYTGEIAQRILACSKRHGGAISAADLAEYRAEWVEPITTTYRGWHVYELPPNGQGIAALMMLNILETLPIGEFGPNSVGSLHAMIEAKKLAFADLARHLADPRDAHVPVEAMLSKLYARDRARLVDPERASDAVEPGRLPVHAGDTIYLTVVDRDGNMVSLIQSNFANFGSGLVPEGAGFVLQNRGGLFTMDAAHPNALAPRKRPFHTIIPAFMSRDHVRIAFGIMGGWNQPQAHAQFVSNVVDHGMNIQAALEAARFIKITFDGCDVMMEGRVPEAVRDGLTRKGHRIDVQGDFSSLVGGGQSTLRDRSRGINYGASDPRKDGAAIPEPIQ
jgi:gamma-glutamyltranspeptidase/glutathione hydrolase